MHIDRYIEVLRLLADVEAQSQYARDVPIADVPAELACMWFDDLNGGRQDTALSPEESATIVSFTRFYESKLDLLDFSGGLEALHESPAWSEVVCEANRALDALVRSRT